jgi:hypothetical protein
MRKWIITALLATSSITMVTPAAWANDTVAAEPAKDAAAIEKMTKMFSDIFDNKDASPIDPARLTLAQTTTAKIMPDGIYSRIMKDMTDKIFGALFSTTNGMSDLEISLTTGVDIDSANFDDAKRQAVTAMLDPNHKERSNALASALNPMFEKMSAAIEGPMREGLARAYARKFSTAQLTELNGFLSTPTGSYYAAESFALQADPEVMQAVFASLPQMLGDLSNPAGIEKGITEKMAGIPEPRKLSNLDDAELGKLADLLGTTVDALKDFSASDAVLTADEEMAEVAVDDPFAGDTGEEPWWDRSNWSEAERRKIVDLETKSNTAAEKSEAAQSAYLDYETEVMKRTRDRYLAKGWTPPVKTE